MEIKEQNHNKCNSPWILLDDTWREW
jgi:hypothetical protein